LNLSENLGNSFEYAKNMLSDVGRLIILIILDLIPIVNWIVIGYAARVLRDSPGSAVPPKLEKYGDMFVDGAKIFFATLIYMIIPALLVGAGVGSFVASSVLSGATNPAALLTGGMMLGGTGLVLVLIGIVVGFFLLVILSVGLAHMIRTRKFGKAFAFSEIFGVIGSIGWGTYIVWLIAIVIIALIVGAIAAIPYLGWLISLVLSPILSVFIFRSLGLLYNEGAPPELRTQAMPSMTTGTACTSCGAVIKPTDKFCPSCGAPAPAPPPPTAANKFCVSCGAKLPTDATFCGSCGAKQS